MSNWIRHTVFLIVCRIFYQLTERIRNMNTLTYEEALEIYNEMERLVDRTDEDILYLYDSLIEKAIRYAHTRSEWTTLTRQERLDKDESRSILHDSFISSVNIISRTQGESGSAWRKRLTEDRKRIGDFACYISLFKALEAR